MSNPIGVDLGSGDDALAVLAFRGPDAAKFLQGQLSADVENLVPGASVRAGLHNPQGRAIALLTLARLSPEDILGILPRALIADVSARLRKFVFRAKVSIEESGLRVLGAPAGADPCGAHAFGWGDRQLLLAPQGRGPATGADDSRWQLDDVRQGLPQVYAATSEQFVAQMLNLDLLGAVAFDKGCYTGQEVIARAHYRGRVKRRMQRWINGSGTPLKPGDAAHSTDGRSLAVVRVAPADDGQEILAVGTFGAPSESGADAVAAPAESGTPVIVSGPLPLPYPLPD
jgi:folate-binding protein YgfZ